MWLVWVRAARTWLAAASRGFFASLLATDSRLALGSSWQLSDEDSASGSPDPVFVHAFPLHLWHLGWHLCPPCLWGRDRGSYSMTLSGANGRVEKLRQVTLKTDGPARQVQCSSWGWGGQRWQVQRAGAPETAASDTACFQTLSCLQASAHDSQPHRSQPWPRPPRRVGLQGSVLRMGKEQTGPGFEQAEYVAVPTLIDHKGFDFCMKSWISWDLEMCRGPMKGVGWLAFLPVPACPRAAPSPGQGVSWEDQRQKQGPTWGHMFLAQRTAE